ncbi:DUF1648 domain-containing protein [Alicyclobacillus pomorum]
MTVVLEAVAFPHLPPQVATHFDVAGQANPCTYHEWIILRPY